MGTLFDFEEQFSSLADAPIIESTMRFACRPEGVWSKKILDAQLPDNKIHQPLYEVTLETEVRPGDANRSTQTNSFEGMSYQTDDTLGVARFLRNGFVYSRLKPYPGWDRFAPEALRLWSIYCNIASPSEVHPLELRFINLIKNVSAENLKDVLRDPPSQFNGVSPATFLYQSTFDVPGHDFSVKVVKTLMTKTPAGRATEGGLILDISVSTTRPLTTENRDWYAPLNKMRWLKNKMFFGLLTDSALNSMARGRS